MHRRTSASCERARRSSAWGSELTARLPAPAIGLGLIAALALLIGCGGGDGAPSATAPARGATTAVVQEPALCRSRLRVRVTGRIGSPTATELSGLVFSPSRRDLLWTHNDSGNSPTLLGVTPAGTTVAEVAVIGAQNVDWEDIADGPRGSLLIGDIGDNLAERPSVVVYRVAEPSASGSVAPAARYELRYPDGPRDAEALLFDRGSQAIVIVSKSFGGTARVYVARRPSSRAVTTLRRRGTISLGPAEAVTGGDVSADGRTIVLRTYDRAFVWRRRAGESIAAALRRRPCRAGADLAGEGQGEALALTADGRALVTVPEGANPTLRRYSVRAARPSAEG